MGSPFQFMVLIGVFAVSGCSASQTRKETIRPGSSAARSFRVQVVGSGRPMILIPGLTCSGEVWNSTVEHFKGRYQMHVLTLAGFAGQPAIQAPFLETVRRDLIGYIQEKNLDHPVVVGHSLGGFMAYWVAATAPALVGPVVAVDGLPFLSDLFKPGATAESSRPGAEQVRRMMASLTPDEFAAQNESYLKNMITDPDNVAKVATESAKSTPSAVGEAMFEMMTTDLRPVVASVKVPTLLVAGGAFAKDDKERRELVAHCERQLANIAHHRVVLADKARHFIMLDDPAFLLSQMDTFLAEARN